MSAYNAGDQGSIPVLGRSGKGSGNPLQYSFLENPMDSGACRLQSMEWQRVEHDWATLLSLSMGIKNIKHYADQVYSQILKI